MNVSHKNRVMAGAVAAWLVLMIAAFGFFFYLNIVTGQSDTLQLRTLRDGRQ